MSFVLIRREHTARCGSRNPEHRFAGRGIQNDQRDVLTEDLG
jgi:hypothetical protein